MENEDKYTVRMFIVGAVNNIGLGVLLAYASTLSDIHGYNYNFAMF
jgi:hypothetical protein